MARPRNRQPDPEVEELNDNPPDPMQEVMTLIREQRDMIRELREELREERAKRNEERLQSTHAETREETQLEETAEGSHRPQESPPHIEHNQGSHGVPAQNDGDLNSWVSKFCKHMPPVFKGRFDPQAAEDWIMRLEKIFEVLECPSEVKAKLAIYKLEGDADRWWRNIAMTMRARNVQVTWEVFQREFNDKFFPKSVRIEKESEFLKIKQGDDETFDEYLSRFVRLSRYSSYLRYKDDEEWSSDMLIRGLRRELKKRLAARQFDKFNKAVEECRITENNLRDINPSKGGGRGDTGKGSSSQKRKDQGFSSRDGSKKSYQGGDRGNQGQLPQWVCPRCNRAHANRNCEGQWVCFLCKQPGHMAKDCKGRPVESRPKSQVRVFAMTHEEARKSPELIQGIILLNGSVLQILIDSGASH